jgi:hypothetical protein
MRRRVIHVAGERAGRFRPETVERSAKSRLTATIFEHRIEKQTRRAEAARGEERRW